MILLSFGLSAQDSGTQSIFMEAGLGARAQGLGKAFVASANDGSAIYWNPAGLDFLPQANFSAYHSTLIQGVYYNFATLTFPLVQFGSVGVGAAHFGVSGINITDLEAYTIGTGDYSEEEYYFSYGKKLPWYGLAFGTTFKITHQSASDPAGGVLQTRSATGSGLDLALMWRPDFASSALSGLSFGLNVQNVVAPSVKLINKTYTDPRMVRVGLAKDFLFGNDQLRRFTILADVNKGSRSKAELNLGAEYSFSRFLAARAGFNNGQLSFGMGTEFTQFQKFSVDYSVNIGTPFGTPLHRLSLTVNFGKTIDERLQIAKATRVDEDRKLVVSNQEAAKSRAIKEHQVMGTELLKNKKLIPALVELEQVVALDPKNENAQRMLDTVRSLMDQQLADQLADTAKQMKELTVNSENRKFVDDHYRKGYAYIQKGDYIAAISEFTTALERSPDNSDIKKSLSETRGLLDKKIASFIAKARASAAGNNFAEALKLLTEARGLDPTNQQIQ